MDRARRVVSANLRAGAQARVGGLAPRGGCGWPWPGIFESRMGDPGPKRQLARVGVP